MKKLGNLLRTLFLVDIAKGLWLTLKYTPQPAFTFQYPAERRPVAPRFRGALSGARASFDRWHGSRNHAAACLLGAIA